jgi:hypothetical protein
MKKILLLGLFILLIGISFVSAEECSDSDGGVDYNTKGTLTLIIEGETYLAEESCVIDTNPSPTGYVWNEVSSCSGDDCYVREGYCETFESSGDWWQETSCENGCSDGACMIKCDENQKKEDWCEDNVGYSRQCNGTNGEWIDSIEWDCNFSHKICQNGKCVEIEEETINPTVVCSDLGIECGETFDVKTSQYVFCGECDIGSVCIANKCYNNDDVGNCIGSPMFPCEEWSNIFSTGYSCEIVGCEWNEKNLSCEGVPKPCSELKDGCLHQRGCEWEKDEKLKSRTYWMEKGKPSLGGVGKISINSEDLKRIENEEITLVMVLENSFLPEDTKVTFEIFKFVMSQVYNPVNDDIGIRVGEDAPIGIIDKDGNAMVEWTITKEDLEFAEYEGHDYFHFKTIVDGEELHNINIAGRIGFGGQTLLLSTKEGDCRGTIPCEILPLDGCEYASDCNWNNEENSCEGIGSLSCTIIEDEETCDIYDCKWKKYGFWKKFASWFGRIFS